MSIRIKWPTEKGWPPEINQAIGSKLQEIIQNFINSTTSGISNNNNQNNNSKKSTDNNNNSNDANDEEDDQDLQPVSSFIQGKVTIDSFSLGKVAPKIILKKILDISPGRSGLLVHFEYKGDAAVAASGIKWNLDPTRIFVEGGGGLSGGRNTDIVTPFFLPLTVSVSDLHLCGDIKIEISHEVEQQQQQSDEKENNNDEGNGRRAAAATGGMFSVPETFTEMFLGQLGFENQNKNSNSNISTTKPSNKKSGSSSNSNQNNINTIGAAVSPNGNEKPKIKRKLFIQLMSEEDFLKDFTLDFNFKPIPRAPDFAKMIIRSLMKPLFQKLKSQGMTVQL